MTRDEENLLFFLEEQLVVHRGLVHSPSMGAADLAIARQWTADGFLAFGQRSNSELPTEGPGANRRHYIAFTKGAWAIAHRLRRERAELHNPTLPDKQTERATHEAAS